MTEITALSATELSAKIRSGTVSSVEVVTAYLQRIDALNGEINAIVSRVDTDLVLAQARACDADLAAGRWRGFLHGMPLAVKDLSEVAGLRCTYGSPLFADFVPDFDDIHVERMRAAGAIFIGKTNTPEWGFGSHSYNPVFGTTRNPYDLTKSAGGSSGGAAAGLAARLLPLADGSDMMGSLRNPAAFNNIVGFRPSFGRVPSGPGPDLYQHQLSTAGPMGRSVRDVAALLAIQSGYDARDPWSLPLEPMELGEQPTWRGRRIGWLGDYGGYLPFEAGVLDLDRSALKVFEDLGMAVDEVLPDFDMDRLWWAWTTLRSWLTVGSMQAIYEDPARRALLKPEILWEIRHGLRVTAADIHEASKIRSAWYKTCLSLFETYDFLILPSAQVFPFDADMPWPREVDGRKMDTYHRWMEVVIGPSMAGLPVAAMPAGFAGNGTSGLPNGIQIVGPPRGDRETLRLALAYEEATDWLKRSAR